MTTDNRHERESIRADVKLHSTDESNYRLRLLWLKLWGATLQQEGKDISGWLEQERSVASHFFWNFIRMVFVSKVTDNELNIKKEDKPAFFKAIDEAYKILEAADKAEPLDMESGNTEVPELLDTGCNWPLYQGNVHHTGCTESKGPSAGVIAWKHPISLAWYSQPKFHDGSLYVTVPGLRNIFKCLDPETGEEEWRTNQLHRLVIDQLYSTPSHSSNPYIIGDKAYIRDIGSRGNDGDTHYIEEISLDTHEVVRRINAKHVDYRTGNSPLDVNDRYIAYIYGHHDIERTPAHGQQLNTVRVIDRETGECLRNFICGPAWANPVLFGDRCYVGNMNGSLFALDIKGPEKKQLAWVFQTKGSFNGGFDVKNGVIYIGNENGKFYAVDEKDGKEIWSAELGTNERAFKLFSRPLVLEDSVIVGSADSHVYSLSKKDGSIIFSTEVCDWVRAMPQIIDDTVIACTITGTVYAIAEDGRILGQNRVTEYEVLADTETDGKSVFISDGNLNIFAVGKDCSLRWQNYILDAEVYRDWKVWVDQIAGGAYYQSKPTVANGKIFAGSPSRFVYAFDERTGRVLWKTEICAAISASPSYYNGKVFFGQQGGSNNFYAVNAETGIKVWTQEIGWSWGSPNIVDGRIYIPEIEGHMLCLDAENGHILWSHKAGRSVCTEPVIDEDRVFFGSWDNFLYGFDQKTGKTLWQFSLGGSSDSGAQIAIDGNLYVPMGGRFFRCLDNRTGEVIWEQEDTDAAHIYNASPAFDGKHIYISYLIGHGLGGVPLKSCLKCVEAETGRFLWEVPGCGLTAPSKGGDCIYFGSTTSPYFSCVKTNGDKCELLWKVNIGGKVEESTTSIANGRAYIICSNGYLYGIG